MQSGSQWNLQENCGNKQRASKWEQTGIFIQSKRASHHHLRLTKTQRQAREWKTLQCKKGSLQVCFDWRSVQAGGKGSWRWTNWKWDILCDWFREHIWLSLVGLELEAETKKKGSWLSQTKTWLFLADCCRSGGLSFHSGCHRDYGSGLYCYIWSIHCPFVYIVSQGKSYAMF